MLDTILPRTLIRITGTAAIAAAAGITLGWPQTTHADRDDLSPWLAPGTRLSPHVVADAELVRDRQAKTGWALRIRAKNSGGQMEHCNVVAAVSELSASPMARVPAPPRLVWEGRTSFEVSPHGELVRELPVSAELARKLTAQAPPPASAKKKSDDPPAPKPPPPPQAQSANRQLPEPALFSSLTVDLRAAEQT
jgi:hypothetical protein